MENKFYYLILPCAVPFQSVEEHIIKKPVNWLKTIMLPFLYETLGVRAVLW